MVTRKPDILLHNAYAVWYLPDGGALEVEYKDYVWMVRRYQRERRGSGILRVTAYVNAPEEAKIMRVAREGLTKIETFGGDVDRVANLPARITTSVFRPNPR
jgi:hypothetical protein